MNIVALPIFIIYILPAYPKTILGWIAVLLLGAPLLLIGEMMGEVLFNDSYKNKLEVKFGESVTSVVRFFHLLGVVIFFVGFYILMDWLAGNFVSNNFGTIW